MVALLKGKDESLRRQALETLAAIGPGTAEVSVVVQAMKGGDAEMRRLALMALGKAGANAKAAVPELFALLKSNDKELRKQVLQALENIRPDRKESKEPLLDLMKAGDKEVGLSAARALINIGEGKATVGFLTGTLKSGSVDEKKASAQVLGLVGADAKPAVDELLNALEKDDARQEAADALVKIGKGAVLKMCKRLVGTDTDKARAILIDSLERIGVWNTDVAGALDAIYRFDRVAEHKKAAERVYKKLAGK
jgi:HEAT repeat protein